MALFAVEDDHLTQLTKGSYATFGLKERQDLQRYFRDQIETIDPELFVVSEEFGHWEEGHRRIDLLAIDKTANLVVIELKRTDSGGFMELQALRYAGMISNMTFEQAVKAHSHYLEARGIDEDAQQRLLDFLDWNEPAEDEFGQDVRIILVSADFSRELTTSVLWLLEKGVDIRCVRVRPYLFNQNVLVNVEQVLPLPEAQEYIIGVREKSRQVKRSQQRDFSKFDVTVGSKAYRRLAKRKAIFRVVKALCDAGYSPEEIWKQVPRSFNTAWRVVEGRVDADEFDELATTAAKSGGYAFDPGRWFHSDGDLIFSGGRTYAFSKMWGAKTEAIVEHLLERFPSHGIAFGRSEEDSESDEL